jgi:hypothetical protein
MLKRKGPSVSTELLSIAVDFESEQFEDSSLEKHNCHFGKHPAIIINVFGWNIIHFR